MLWLQSLSYMKVVQVSLKEDGNLFLCMLTFEFLMADLYFLEASLHSLIRQIKILIITISWFLTTARHQAGTLHLLC